MNDEIIETDLLIVGAGPAGAALACFLASYGIFLGNFGSFFSSFCLQTPQGELE
jgi:alkyl hydroperoxide reductase subunit AhpF